MAGEAGAVVTVITPAPKTFTALKTEVARYAKLPDDADALAVAADGISRAINKLNLNRWNIQRKHFDKATVANQKEYDVPVDWMAPLYCELLNSTTSSTAEIIGRLDYVSPSSFEFSFVDRSAASQTPTNWTVFNAWANAKMTLNANPSSSWVATNLMMRVRYFATFDYPASGSATISTNAQVEAFVTWDAKSYIAKHYLNSDKQQIADEEATDALAMLKNFDDMIAGSLR